LAGGRAAGLRIPDSLRELLEQAPAASRAGPGSIRRGIQLRHDLPADAETHVQMAKLGVVSEFEEPSETHPKLRRAE